MAWRHENPERHKLLTKLCVWRRKDRLRQIIDEAKARPCADCSQNFNPWQMDFDHRPGTVKVARISRLVADACSDEELLAEIDKCDVVCANCHRQRTHDRGTHARSPLPILPPFQRKPSPLKGPDVVVVCRACGKSFTKTFRLYKMGERRHPGRGYFCSRSCVGKHCGAGRSS